MYVYEFDAFVPLLLKLARTPAPNPLRSELGYDVVGSRAIHFKTKIMAKEHPRCSEFTKSDLFTLGDFTWAVSRKIGEGSYGKVYLGWTKVTGKPT